MNTTLWPGRTPRTGHCTTHRRDTHTTFEDADRVLDDNPGAVVPCDVMPGWHVVWSFTAPLRVAAR